MAEFVGACVVAFVVALVVVFVAATDEDAVLSRGSVATVDGVDVAAVLPRVTRYVRPELTETSRAAAAAKTRNETVRGRVAVITFVELIDTTGASNRSAMPDHKSRDGDKSGSKSR